MSNEAMEPTNKLRFVARVVPAIEHGQYFGKTIHIHILQQWWEDGNIVLATRITDNYGNVLPSPKRGEWRDVPVEAEA